MSSNSINAISIPISDYAVHIEDDLREYLVEPIEGVYFRGSKNPFIKGPVQNLKEAGYTQKIYSQTHSVPVHVPLIDVAQIVGDVFNKDGEMVLKAPREGFRASDFHYRPMVPSIGLHIVKEYADNVIDNHVKWRDKVDGFHRLLDRYIKGTDRYYITDIAKPLTDNVDEALSVFCEERIRSVLGHLADDLARFVNTDPWHIYLTQPRRNSDLMVLKTKDFRVAEWERLKAEGKI